MPHIPRRPKPAIAVPEIETPESTKAPLAVRAEMPEEPLRPRPVTERHRETGPSLPIISMQKHSIGPSEVARLLFGC